jgi:3-hydroxyacyl-[acyl-carrier-protein] dehydratase
MNKDEIKNILPHRDPMLLIDETELDGDTAIGKYTVRGDEYFLQGHFPGNPVVPGVILCEMMAQSSCLLVKADGEKFTPYFTGLNNVKFKDKVKPGDTVTFKCQKTAQKGPFYFVKGSGYVNEKLCVTGELSFAVVV